MTRDRDHSGNLPFMKVFDDDTRRRLATGWDPRVCTARDYARSVGVSERALRVWRARYLGEKRQVVPTRHGVVPLDGTMEALDARLAELDGALVAAHAAVAACRAALDAEWRRLSDGTTAMVEQDVVNDHPVTSGVPLPVDAEHPSLLAHDCDEVPEPFAGGQSENALDAGPSFEPPALIRPEVPSGMPAGTSMENGVLYAEGTRKRRKSFFDDL